MPTHRFVGFGGFLGSVGLAEGVSSASLVSRAYGALTGTGAGRMLAASVCACFRLRRWGSAACSCRTTTIRLVHPWYAVFHLMLWPSSASLMPSGCDAVSICRTSACLAAMLARLASLFADTSCTLS